MLTLSFKPHYMLHWMMKEKVKKPTNTTKPFASSYILEAVCVCVGLVVSSGLGYLHTGRMW